MLALFFWGGVWPIAQSSPVNDNRTGLPIGSELEALIERIKHSDAWVDP